MTHHPSHRSVDNPDVLPLRDYGEAVTFRAGDTLYVDECKARGYLIVGTAAARSDIAESNRTLRTLLKPGQRRIHFKSESDARRRHILSRMVELDVRSMVWRLPKAPDKVARPRLLEALTETAVLADMALIVIERDESTEQMDRRVIAAKIRGLGGRVRYDHAAPHEHPVLWVSDAVAWCHSHGGDWARRAAPIVDGRVVRL